MDIQNQVKNILKSCEVPNGFLATAVDLDNYKRVWARDSSITGLAILISEMTEFYPTIEKSIIGLKSYQSDLGVIPSNIPANEETNKKASFGSLVGRVDATTWWIIQSIAYIKTTQNEKLKIEFKEAIYRSLDVLTLWEFNGRNLIYTPIGGNWADEYISNGYTLYDNILRYWAVKLTASFYEDQGLEKKVAAIRESIDRNFNPDQLANESTIHLRTHTEFQSKKLNHWPSSFSPIGYDTRWDMAGNALATLLGFKNPNLSRKLKELQKEQTDWMLPVFHPVILPGSDDWKFLAENYNFNFKNNPHQFHNGGSWPVMLGLLCLGLAKNGDFTEVDEIKKRYYPLLMNQDSMDFSEYFNPEEKVFGGLKHMCFSASGWLFMESALQPNKTLNLILN